MQNLIVNFLGTWSNTVNYSYLDLSDIILNPVVATGLTPSVQYMGGLYVGNNSANPTLGTVPPSDSAWTLVATTESGSGVLATPLTGLTVATGTPISTSTILQSFGYLTYRTYGSITGWAIATLSGTPGVVPLTAATYNGSSNMSIVTSTGVITLPVTKTVRIFVNLIVTTAATSGATFTITGSAAAPIVQTNAVTIGASQTAAPVTLIAYTTTTSGTPTVTINSSSITGTVSILAASFITLDA